MVFQNLLNSHDDWVDSHTTSNWHWFRGRTFSSPLYWRASNTRGYLVPEKNRGLKGGTLLYLGCSRLGKYLVNLSISPRHGNFTQFLFKSFSNVLISRWLYFLVMLTSWSPWSKSSTYVIHQKFQVRKIEVRTYISCMDPGIPMVIPRLKLLGGSGSPWLG